MRHTANQARCMHSECTNVKNSHQFRAEITPHPGLTSLTGGNGNGWPLLPPWSGGRAGGGGVGVVGFLPKIGGNFLHLCIQSAYTWPDLRCVAFDCIRHAYSFDAFRRVVHTCAFASRCIRNLNAFVCIHIGGRANATRFECTYLYASECVRMHPLLNAARQ